MVFCSLHATPEELVKIECLKNMIRLVLALVLPLVLPDGVAIDAHLCTFVDVDIQTRVHRSTRKKVIKRLN